jgi:hypothetical protein
MRFRAMGVINWGFSLCSCPTSALQPGIFPNGCTAVYSGDFITAL